MATGEGSFAASQKDEPRFEPLPARRFAVRHHDGPLDRVDDTRRPMYQFMIMEELVAGPSVLRFAGDEVDVMVGCAAGFDGMDDLALDTVSAGTFAVLDYEGPEDGLEQARHDLRTWVEDQGRTPSGPMLQVHMMDAIDGDVEQQLQLPVDD